MEDSVYRPATSKVFAKMQTNMTTRLRKVFFAYDNGVGGKGDPVSAVSYTHLRAHETDS